MAAGHVSENALLLCLLEIFFVECPCIIKSLCDFELLRSQIGFKRCHCLVGQSMFSAKKAFLHLVIYGLLLLHVQFCHQLTFQPLPECGFQKFSVALRLNIRTSSRIVIGI